MTYLDAHWRRQFPAAERWTYLDGASTGILPERAREAIETFARDLTRNGATKSAWAEALDLARSRFATLIGGDPTDIAFTKNCTEGVNLVASGLGLEAGDNVVVPADLEHPANIYPWLNLRSRGVEVRRVAPRDLAIDPDAVTAAMDRRTRVVAVSSVTFVPGFRTEVGELARICDERGVLLLVDATQSAGVLRIDVGETSPGALVVSTHKHLLSLYGQGLIWCRPDWARRLRPAHVGQHGMADPLEHPQALDYALEPAVGARRLEYGQMPLAAAALAASLELLLEAGPAVVEAHACGLAERLADGFDDLGLDVTRSPAGTTPSHVVCLGDLRPGSLYGLDDPFMHRLHERLDVSDVRHSARRGMLRFAFHLYNGENDVNRVLEIADSVVREESA